MVGGETVAQNVRCVSSKNVFLFTSEQQRLWKCQGGKKTKKQTMSPHSTLAYKK